MHEILLFSINLDTFPYPSHWSYFAIALQKNNYKKTKKKFCIAKKTLQGYVDAVNILNDFEAK